MKKKKIYEGKILGLSVYDGKIEGRKVKREMIEHRGAAAMLAFDDDGKIILVKQHRFPHGYVLEIPAGTLEKKEEPIKCAYRELEEETGYRAKKMTSLITYYPSIGYNTEVIHCFVASGLKKIADLKLDEDEILSVIKMDLKKLLKLIKSGKIQDSKTICAVLAYAAKKKLY
ncbi:MAG: NUDIX hydrolase [Nitrosopumilus sp.]|uniref:NUDIX hydrolase n=1 Tax=Nitrosopumilus sp. TaxID=2024843 RepID=UPI00242BCD60|nr:NUDIX hydrolase [Nitrosopumilus sp.]MCV0365793.1 NUDIX hydrolase [Nitrosopumilus sp.]